MIKKLLFKLFVPRQRPRLTPEEKYQVLQADHIRALSQCLALKEALDAHVIWQEEHAQDHEWADFDLHELTMQALMGEAAETFRCRLKSAEDDAKSLRESWSNCTLLVAEYQETVIGLKQRLNAYEEDQKASV